MRNFKAPVFCRSIIIMLAVLLSATKLTAQTDIAIGTGMTGNANTTYPCPLQDYFEGSRMQYLYTASELLAAGMSPGNISAIKFNVLSLATSANTSFAMEQMEIRIGGTTTASLSATAWEAGTASVYGPIDYLAVVGTNTFNFSSPFIWNGTDNIVIEICNGDPTNGTYISYTGNPVVPWTEGLTFNGSHSYRADNLGNLCASPTTTNTGLQTTRPNIIFSWTSATACTGTPVGGTTTSTVSSVCNSTTPFTLSVTGSTSASGLTYQWESSLDNTSWSPIGSATSFSYGSPGISVSTYFRRITSCGSNSAASVSVLVTASTPTYAALPYNESFENTWASICGTRDVPSNSWRNNPVTGSQSWRRDDDYLGGGWASAGGAYTPPASNGLHSARFHSFQAPDNSKGALTLYVDCSPGSAAKRLTFDFINTSDNDSITISISTNGGTSFTRLDSTGIATAWRSKAILFNSNSATTVFKFEATSLGGTDIGLDNISIINFADCAGTPNGGTAITSSASVCTESFTVSLTGSSSAAGLTYQWERSIDNGVTWTPIPGATSTSYTTTQVQTTLYRAVVTCTFSNQSATSSSVQVVSPPAASGVYTINSAVPTDIPGRTFQTFNAAYNFIKCGISSAVLFNVINGPYNEQLTMTQVPGTSAQNTVTFKGNGTAAIGFGSSNNTERAVIKLRGTRHIIFDSLIINANSGTYGYGVQLMTNADSNIVRNCTINLSTTVNTQNYAGIVINGTDAGPVSTGATVVCLIRS